MKKYEILDKKTEWEGRFLKGVVVTYRNSRGVLQRWESVERRNCDGIVAVVPFTDEGEVIFIRQFRPPVNSYVIEFPAGLNDRGESTEEAARRELMEETGYEAKEMAFLARGPLSSGSSGEILTVYLARGLIFRGVGQGDETEEIEVLKVPADEVYEQLSRLETEGHFIDIKVFGLLEMAKRVV
ncbi:MAG TPA: NUDIX hydrolase [Thermodesulfovibrionales bacterium]|nr:NUDIX hydrolase [Thermodesulfovibrionales bacterium]